MTIPTLTYRATGAGVHVDLDRLVASRALIQANSGGGKSRAIRQLLEETHGRVQHLVIDPEGEFPTLRERFDYVLAAKQGGEALASPRYASKLCRRLVELGASAVLDLYELPLDDRRAFVRLFLTELMGLPRSDGVRRDQLSVLVGFKKSTRNLYVQRLARAGYVEERGAAFVATDEGVRVLGDDYEPLPTGKALRDYWMGELPEGERRLFAIVCDRYPERVPRDEFDELTEYSKSTRNLYLQRLARRELIEGRGDVRASATLFEDAR